MTELERAIAKAMRAAGYDGGPEVYARPLGDGFELCVQPALEDADDGGVDLWAMVWVRLPAAEEVLEGLRRDEVPWASCNPDVLVTVHGSGEVGDAVAVFRRGVDEAVGKAARLASPDAFVAAVRAELDAADEAPLVVPVVLAVLGREAEAREALAEYRAERGDDDYADFAARFEAWLGGAPLDPEPPPEQPELAFGDVLKEGVRRALAGERPPPRTGGPGLGELFQAGARMLRGEESGLPPIAWRWVPVELDAGADAVLEGAVPHGSVSALLQAAGDGRYRVVVAGTPVGSVVIAPTREISVLGRVEPGPALQIRLRDQS